MEIILQYFWKKWKLDTERTLHESKYFWRIKIWKLHTENLCVKKVYLKQLAVRYKTTLIERKYLKEKVGKQYRLHIGKVCVHEVKSIALNNACNENVKPLIPRFS